MRLGEASWNRPCILDTHTLHALISVQNCPSLWRIYTYLTDAEREIVLDNRESKSRLGFNHGGEGYIARDQWCYNCGECGHLGDVSYVSYLFPLLVMKKHKIRIVIRRLIMIVLRSIRRLVPLMSSVDLSPRSRLLLPKLHGP